MLSIGESIWMGEIHGYVPLPRNSLGTFVLELEGPVSEEMPMTVEKVANLTKEKAKKLIGSCESWHDIDKMNARLIQNSTFHVQIKPAIQNQATNLIMRRTFTNNKGAKFLVELALKSFLKGEELCSQLSNFLIVLAKTNWFINHYQAGQNLLQRIQDLAIYHHLVSDQNNEIERIEYAPQNQFYLTVDNARKIVRNHRNPKREMLSFRSSLRPLNDS